MTGLLGRQLQMAGSLVPAKVSAVVSKAAGSALKASMHVALTSLRKGGQNAYAKARRALIQESRAWWDEHVDDESHPATAEGLAEFIRETLEPICYRMEREARFTPAIKSQILGEGLQASRLEPLNRYETHLDRKFERTLAMILKLKELRRG